MAKKKTTEECIIEFRQVHGDRYDYSLFVYTGVHKKGIIICPVHQKQFEQTPANHLNGQGCPDCGMESRVLLRTKSTEQFVIEANIKHGIGRYDYSLVDYKDAKTKVIIICSIHNTQFLQTPTIHLRGHGCPDCASERQSLRQSKTTEDCIIDFENKHGKGTYDYSLFVNNGIKSKSIIICPIHQKQFLMTPNDHLNGCGCPLCKESRGEAAIRSWLTNNNIEFDTQHNPIQEYPRLKFDFWLPDNRLLIEFDGKQHYEPNERFGGQIAFEAGQLRDQQKTEWAVSNNIKLLRIKYTEINKIPLLLTHHLFNNKYNTINTTRK